jgi:citrate synthase
MAALAVGAGSLGGAREVALAMGAWHSCGKDLEAWRARWAHPSSEPASAWPPAEHPAGFDPHGVSTSTPVRQTLAQLAALDASSRSAWLSEHLPEMERAAGRALALTGVAAAAFGDLGFSAEAGEMLYLLVRLPGAAAHALEQAGFGHKRFPWYEIEVEASESEPR